MRVALRPAARADVDFLVGLANDDAVEPFLGARQPRGRADLEGEVERTAADPDRFGRLVVEADGERVGSVTWELVNERSSIVRLERLALLPSARGRGVALEASRALVRHLLVERGFHRLELEVYAFNQAALRLADRVGYVREGVKRRAYRRHGAWNDAVLFALLREDLAGVGEDDPARPAEPVVPAFAEAVIDLVDAIPEGMVLAYGDVAELLGEGGPRQVGHVMSRYGSATHWWRVVRASGEPARGLEGEALGHLRAEGVPLVRGTLSGRRVDMGRARWPGPPR